MLSQNKIFYVLIIFFILLLYLFLYILYFYCIIIFIAQCRRLIEAKYKDICIRSISRMRQEYAYEIRREIIIPRPNNFPGVIFPSATFGYKNL
jgi:ATP/ADP translocase